MPPRSAIVQLLAAAAVTTFTIVAVYFLSTAAAKAPDTAVTAPPPGIVTYPEHAAQLSSIAVLPVQLEVMPLLGSQAGRIAYNENLTTRVSSPIAGRVLATPVEVGDMVRRGQALAQLDAPDLATAEADLHKAHADEVRKQRAVDRARTLFDGEVLARKDLEGAEADVDQARSETRRAALRMRNLNASGSQNGVYTLKAGLTGIVAERQINPGQEVRPDLATPLFVITDLDRLWVIVDVPEQAAGVLHAGQAARVESDAWPAQTFDATIERVGVVLDPVTRRVQVRCQVRNDARKLKPEMFARVSFLPDGAGAKAFALPNSSLVVEGRYTYVFVQTRPGRFEKRRVTVHTTGRDHSFIDGGLVSGDAVVTEGAFLLTSEAGGDAR